MGKLLAEALTSKADMPREIFDCPVISYRVIDGDTQEVVIDRGWRVSQTVTTRLDGIDAPELRSGDKLHNEAGHAVSLVVERWLAGACVDPFRLRLLSKSLDKYGRSLSDFRDRMNPQTTLTQFLLRARIVRHYDGQSARVPWAPKQIGDVLERCRIILGDHP